MEEDSTLSKFIVDPDDIMFIDEIRKENLILEDFSFRTPLETIQWAAKRLLLHNEVECQNCTNNSMMSLIHRSQSQDGYGWKCDRCHQTLSIRADSFFTKSHLSIKQILKIVYGWAANFSPEDISRESRVREYPSSPTIELYNFCCTVCEQFLIDHPTLIGGFDDYGVPKIVEIDECRIFHRCLQDEEHWVFGGIERGGSDICFLVEVPDRSQEILTAVIQKYVLPGTIIVSNASRGYDYIGKINDGMYEHRDFIPGNGVDPRLNINLIKSLFSRIRKFGRYCDFSNYLHEFLWKTLHEDRNVVGEFFATLENFTVLGMMEINCEECSQCWTCELEPSGRQGVSCASEELELTTYPRKLTMFPFQNIYTFSKV